MRARLAVLLAVALAGCDDSATEVVIPEPSPLPEYVTRPDSVGAKDFSLVYDGELFHLFHNNVDGGWGNGGAKSFGHATSSQLTEWDYHENLDLRVEGDWSEDNIWAPSIIRHGDSWYMFYTGVDIPDGLDKSYKIEGIGMATSQDLFHWELHDGNGFLLDGATDWSNWGSGDPWSRDCRDPFVMLDDGLFHLYFNAQLADGRPVVAHSTSEDLLAWSAIEPLLETAGTRAESPCVLVVEGGFYLFWTGPMGVEHAFAASLDAGWESRGKIDVSGYANETLRCPFNELRVLFPYVTQDQHVAYGEFVEGSTVIEPFTTPW